MPDYQGMFIVIFADFGPKVIFNSSILPGDLALNFGVQGLTALQRGENETLYGPLPVPQPGILGLVLTMRILVKKSMDKRFVKSGRPVNVWILITKTMLHRVFARWNTVESGLRRIIHQLSLKSDDDLVAIKLTEFERRTRSLLENI